MPLIFRELCLKESAAGKWEAFIQELEYQRQVVLTRNQKRKPNLEVINEYLKRVCQSPYF